MTQKQEGGYDVTLVSEENIYQYECCICQLILRDVQQVVPCGHRFCLDCMKNHQKDSLNCPSCRGGMASIFPDAAWNREIMNLKVKCQNHNKSCDWTGELRELHEHYKLCGRLNNCGMKDVRRKENQVVQHIQNECSVTVHECKYKSIGCEIRGDISTLEKHVEENTEQHLQKAVQKVNSLQNTLGYMQRNLEEYKANTNFMFKVMQYKLRCYSCPFTFVLTNFKKKLVKENRNNSKIVSDDFFCLNGYHAELWIYLNGNGIYRGYVGVYINLIKGPFDDEMEWPMKAQIEFRLKGVNCDDKVHTVITSTLTEERQQKYFSNPRIVSERRSGYGFSTFISHEDLHKYMKSDSLTFIIDVTGLSL